MKLLCFLQCIFFFLFNFLPLLFFFNRCCFFKFFSFFFFCDLPGFFLSLLISIQQKYIYECYSLKRLNVVSLLYYTASNGNFTFLKRKMALFQVASYTCTSIHNNATYSDRALQGLIIQTAL